MVMGLCGYGRYDDDPDCIGCPRAQSDMTPCIARDEHALADTGVCVGCGSKPADLLNQLREAGAEVGPKLTALRPSLATQCQALREAVAKVSVP